jgi:hypothetical protein
MNYKCIKDYRRGLLSSPTSVFVKGVTYTKEQVTTRVPIHMIPGYFRKINDSEESESVPNSESISFNSLLDQIKDTHEKKNHDYGNSFAKSMDEFGMPAAAIRLSDKLNRFKALINSEAKVKDESVEDTLLDMASYAIMTVEYLKKKKL